MIFIIQEDTIKLLRECNSGVKMGVSSIDEVIPNVKSTSLKEILEKSKNEHERLGNKTNQMLCDYSDEGKEPNSVAKGMSWMKTNIMMTVNPGDDTIADLLTDGCNMGVKSLNRFLNEYEAAEEKSKDIAKKLINLEQKLSDDIRDFL